jgi:hypothetical protein
MPEMSTNDSKCSGKKEKQEKLRPVLDRRAANVDFMSRIVGLVFLLLSTFGARHFYTAKYRGTLFISWIPDCCRNFQ